MYTEPTSNDLAQHGHHIYSMFNTVVILDQVLRQHGANPDIARFRDLLLRLRNGCVTEDDWKLLLTRDPSKIHNSDDFKDAIRLFYDKENVARYNLEKLQSLPTPVAQIHAVHNNSSATCAKPDDAGGLYPTVFVAVDARVMLTANLWPEVGLCNGAAGTVHDILYKKKHQPPNLPIAVLVIFDHYSGPSFLQQHSNCVPIPPITYEWDSDSQRLSRQQLPLQVRYAITIHKSQGQTLPKAVIDIGKAELANGCTFVAISRLPRLDCGLIQPMSLQRLKNPCHSRG